MSTPDHLAVAVSTQPDPGLTRVAGPVPPQVSDVGGLTRDVWLFEAGDFAVGELEVDGGGRVVEVPDFGGSDDRCAQQSLSTPTRSERRVGGLRVVGSQLRVAVDLVRQFDNRLHQGIPFSSAGSLWSAPSTATRRTGPRAAATDRRLSSEGTMESCVPYTTVIGTATRAAYSATGKRSFSNARTGKNG